MSTVLVADDDQGLLDPICRYLSKRNRAIKTLSAATGAESIKILESEKVDVVLSDLRMPDGDGIDILAYLCSRPTPIPVILMSGYIQSEAAEALRRFGHLRFLGKPARLDRIFETIQEVLRSSEEIGSFSDFSVAGVLQLIEMEGKTCMVEVHSRDGREGCFVFAGGRLQAAHFKDLAGEDAALEMLSWGRPEVKVRGLPDASAHARQFGGDVTGLLMRSLQMKDELEAAEAGHPSAPAGTLHRGDTEAGGRSRAVRSGRRRWPWPGRHPRCSG